MSTDIFEAPHFVVNRYFSPERNDFGPRHRYQFITRWSADDGASIELSSEETDALIKALQASQAEMLKETLATINGSDFYTPKD